MEVQVLSSAQVKWMRSHYFGWYILKSTMVRNKRGDDLRYVLSHPKFFAPLLLVFAVFLFGIFLLVNLTDRQSFDSSSRAASKRIQRRWGLTVPTSLTCTEIQTIVTGTGSTHPLSVSALTLDEGNNLLLAGITVSGSGTNYPIHKYGCDISSGSCRYSWGNQWSVFGNTIGTDLVGIEFGSTNSSGDITVYHADQGTSTVKSDSVLRGTVLTSSGVANGVSPNPLIAEDGTSPYTDQNKLSIPQGLALYRGDNTLFVTDTNRGYDGFGPITTQQPMYHHRIVKYNLASNTSTKFAGGFGIGNGQFG